MAQQPTSPRVPAQNDIYTALLIMAGVLQFAGLVFLLVRSVQLFDWPWSAG